MSIGVFIAAFFVVALFAAIVFDYGGLLIALLFFVIGLQVYRALQRTFQSRDGYDDDDHEMPDEDSDLGCNQGSRQNASRLADFQNCHVLITAPQLRNSCGSCRYWMGQKVTESGMRGVYVNKKAKGDCSNKRVGSRLRDRAIDDGRACRDYEQGF